MKEQVKLMLKGLSEETGAPFTKEVHTLDEVKSCGNYTVIGRNVSTANGLPSISGKKHNCFCCEAKLTVTCCYPESESQSDSAYGQCLTICDRETGEANTYTRSIAPTKNKGKWSAWKMVATGNIDLISQNSDIQEKFLNMTEKIDKEVLRAMSAEETLNVNINELNAALDYTADYIPGISNGTQGNAGNTNAIRLSKKIPGEVGKTYTIITNRPPDEGCIYVYGRGVYNSLAGAIYQNYSRPVVDYSAKSTINYVTLQEGEVGFNFVVAQWNATTGEYVPLRTTSFNGYEIKIKTSNVIDSISETLQAGTTVRFDGIESETKELLMPEGEFGESPEIIYYAPKQKFVYRVGSTYYDDDGTLGNYNANGKIRKDKLYLLNATIYAWNGSDLVVASSTGGGGIDADVLAQIEANTDDINALKEVIDYTVDYIAAISNGTQGSAGNTTAIRLSKKIPGEVGKTYAIITNRPPDEGCIYVYGRGVYSSLEGAAYQNYSRPVVEYGAKSTVNYVTLQEGEVGFNFVVAQWNATTGEYVPLRTTSFNGYEIKIKTYNAIDNINETLRVLTSETPIYKRNTDRVIALNAMCRNRKSTAAPNKDFQLLICTDSHGDKQPTKNSIDALNSFPTLDAWIHCGDILPGHYSPTGIETFADCVKNAKKPFFAVIGNHDVGSTPYVAASATHEQAYAAFIKPSVDAGWLKAGEYTEGKPYWYHDDATYKIRLIGLYEYDDPMDFDETYWKRIPYDETLPEIKKNTSFNVGDKANPTVWGYGSEYFKYTAYSFECVNACSISGTNFHNAITYLPKYKIQRGTRVIRQEQAQWFLDTLASTPTGYGVIVAMHNPFSDTATTIEAKFTQVIGKAGSAMSQNLMQTDFIRNAVVAFIKGVNYSEEVVMKGSAAYLNTIPSGGGDDYAYLVEKDFSTKNSDVNFLGFVGGHVHRDLVWKDASENIYQITPCCAATDMENAKNNDIRCTSEDGPAKDSLTVVSFASGRIALAKIGVNVTENGTARDYEVISK